MKIGDKVRKGRGAWGEITFLSTSGDHAMVSFGSSSKRIAVVELLGVGDAPEIDVRKAARSTKHEIMTTGKIGSRPVCPKHSPKGYFGESCPYCGSIDKRFRHANAGWTPTREKKR